jgi:hypothetical protein
MYVANSKRLTNEGAKTIIATAVAKAREAGIAIDRNYDPPNAVPLDTWILGRKRRPYRIALKPLSYTDPRVNPKHVPATASLRSTVRRESIVAPARWLVFPRDYQSATLPVASETFASLG